MTIEQSESNYKYMIHLTILGFLNGLMDVPITFNTMCYNWVSEILKEFGWEEDPDNVFELNGWAADFLLNGKYLVECKPTKLMKSVNVQLKKEAALKFCKDKNLIYKLTNCPILSDNEIKELYDNEDIKFLEKYEKKFKQWIPCSE